MLDIKFIFPLLKNIFRSRLSVSGLAPPPGGGQQLAPHLVLGEDGLRHRGGQVLSLDQSGLSIAMVWTNERSVLPGRGGSCCWARGRGHSGTRCPRCHGPPHRPGHTQIVPWFLNIPYDQSSAKLPVIMSFQHYY